MKLVTIMRDSSSYLDRFIDQATHIPGDVSIVIAEGDSTDDTAARLREYRAFDDIDILTVQHGGPYFPSIDHPMRWRQLAAVCNVAMTAAVRDLAPDEPLVYVESDLIWDPDTIARLAKHVSTYPAVAPMSMQGDRFYDTWGHTKEWEGFRPYVPHFDGWSDSMMHQITSAGSCFALSWTAAQVAQFSPVDCIRGIGRSLRENGLSLWLDPHLRVEHP